MSWSEYVTERSRGDVNRVIAAKLGVTEPSVARWKSGATRSPDARQAAAFARAYGRPVLEAFVAAEFLSADEAKVHPSAAPSLDSLSDDELVVEIQKRLRKRGAEDVDSPATTKAAGSGRRLQAVDNEAARNVGRIGTKAQARLDQDRAGQPPADDPDDMEPR